MKKHMGKSIASPAYALKLRKAFKQGIKNPIAKELLQGDGRLGAKVVQGTKAERLAAKPKTKWTRVLEPDEDSNK